ncbi:hemolysin [Dokdonia pacifica]|uniref:Multidrug resistance efflux pump n=1 Tax=Dokdonia pacifica TaxID=1627892 RepID=A0A239A1V5_9FLAO|nr:HlyD family efflux transporter periplasmic adaptor subunit [Dokdonia pacifica]GGG34480.1 hemolysin [Dokdonia pacifica]SNR89479.1 Multidrug resistance efflux pump [Dokdonia pacifica]
MPDQIDDIELRSEEVQEILTQAPNWMIRWGSALFLGLIILLLAISWFLEYPDIIPSQAIITTQVPPQKERAKNTGRFSAILVDDNQEVVKDQPLAIIENTANYQDIYTLKAALDTISLQGESFYFPYTDIPELSLGNIETNYALFVNSYVLYELNREFQPFSNRAIANRTSISQTRNRLENMKAQREINKEEMRLAKIDLDRDQKFLDNGVIAPSEFERTRIGFLQAERNFKSIDAQISQLVEGVSVAQSTAKGTEIDGAREERTLLNGVIQSLNVLKASIKDWELNFALTSKLDGKVSFLNFWSENQTVNAGDVVFTIIPKDGSEYVAKLKTPAQNSGKIKLGQEVIIRLENYPDTEFGTLDGKIEKISVIADEDGMYAIDVSLPDTLITTFDKEIDFQQEMRGTGDIVTEDLRLIERFFYQLRNVFKR